MRLHILNALLICFAVGVIGCGDGGADLVSPAQAQALPNNEVTRQLGGVFPNSGGDAIDLLLQQTGEVISGKGVIRRGGTVLPFIATGRRGSIETGYFHVSLFPSDQSVTTDEIFLDANLDTGLALLTDTSNETTIEFQIQEASDDQIEQARARLFEGNLDVNSNSPEKYRVELRTSGAITTAAPGADADFTFELNRVEPFTVRGPQLAGSFEGALTGQSNHERHPKSDQDISGIATAGILVFTKTALVEIDGRRTINSETLLDNPIPFDHLGVTMSLIFDFDQRRGGVRAGDVFSLSEGSSMFVEYPHPASSELEILPGAGIRLGVSAYARTYRKFDFARVTLVSKGSL